MRLLDLLDKVSESTTVWIAEDPTVSEGIYFGRAGDVKVFEARGYEVVEFYPEHYPVIYNFAGISIIVRKDAHA